MTDKECIVSIWADGEVNQGNYKGCGVCVSAYQLITAKHVIKGLDKNQITVGGIPNNDKGLQVSEIHRHENKDIAILKLSHPHGKEVVKCSFNRPNEEEQNYFLLTYNKATGTPKRNPNIAITNPTNEGGWEINYQPAKGESGGGVFLDKYLVGVVQARDTDEKTGIFVPFFGNEDFINDFIKESPKIEFSDSISEEEFTRIQLKIIATRLEHEDAIKINTIVTDTFSKTCSIKTEGKVLANYIEDFLKNNGKLELLRKLVHMTNKMVEEGCSEKTCDQMDLFFSEILLLTTPLNDLKNCHLVSDGMHILSLRTESAVELFLSRMFEKVPKFKLIRDNLGNVISVMGRCGFSFDQARLTEKYKELTKEQCVLPETGWDANLITDVIEHSIKSEIDGRPKSIKLDEFERKELREYLSLSRKDGDIYRIEVNSDKCPTHLLSDIRVVNEINSRYKDLLPVVLYGNSELDDEPNISSIIKRFYRTLEGCRKNDK